MSLWGRDLLTRIMKMILQEKGWIHRVPTIWCAIFPMHLQQWKYQMPRQQGRKIGKNSRKYRHGSWRKSKTKMRWSMKQGLNEEKFNLRHWWISVISRIQNWSLNFKNTKAESYSEVTLWRMIQDHTQYLLNKDHQHHRWQPHESRTLSRLPDAQDKQQMQYPLTPRSKWKMHRRYLKIPKSECPDIWIRLPKHKWPKSWSSMEDPVVPLERNVYGHPLAGLLWQRQF